MDTARNVTVADCAKDGRTVYDYIVDSMGPGVPREPTRTDLGSNEELFRDLAETDVSNQYNEIHTACSDAPTEPVQPDDEDADDAPEQVQPDSGCAAEVPEPFQPDDGCAAETSTEPIRKDGSRTRKAKARKQDDPDAKLISML